MSAPRGWGWIALLGTALGWPLLGCEDGSSGHAPGADAGSTRDAAPRVRRRTVRVQIVKTAERTLDRQADGSLHIGPLTPIGGVEICLRKRRPAFASFEPFADVDPPLCGTNVAGQHMWLEQLPADSDLIFTLRKDGLEPASMTFRTDDRDTAVPLRWGESTYLTLVPDGAAEPWLEPMPAPQPRQSAVTLWATAIWSGDVPVPPSIEGLPWPATANLAMAEGVDVEIEDATGQETTRLATLRDRPRFLSLPSGLYRMRFSHPRFELRPVGVESMYVVAGLPTERYDTIEVPVFEGYASSVMFDGLCVPDPLSRPAEDLPTCTVAALDAGAP